MGPNDGKSFINTADIPQLSNSALPPIASTRLNSTLNNTLDSSVNQKKSGAGNSNRQIAKKEISAPTNFRHVVKGLEEYGLSSAVAKDITTRTQSLSSSRIGIANTPNNGPPCVPPPPLPNQQNHISIKSSSLSSSSSSSSSILHSPHSPSSSNNENLSQAISNTLKANSVLYNG